MNLKSVFSEYDKRLAIFLLKFFKEFSQSLSVNGKYPLCGYIQITCGQYIYGASGAIEVMKCMTKEPLTPVTWMNEREG